MSKTYTATVTWEMPTESPTEPQMDVGGERSAGTPDVILTPTLDHSAQTTGIQVTLAAYRPGHQRHGLRIA